jgi:hypothetical protein
MRGALLAPLIGLSADVLGGLGIDQRLQHQSEPFADDVQGTASAQCIQQLGQGRLAAGHRGELLGVNLGRITLSFTRWPSPCYSAEQGPVLKVHHYPGRLLRLGFWLQESSGGGLGDTISPCEGAGRERGRRAQVLDGPLRAARPSESTLIGLASTDGSSPWKAARSARARVQP